MLDMSWGEMMIIGAVALIVIGPKDLPKALRTVGQMVGKIRRMAAEFQGQFNQAMREAELDEVKRQIQGVNDSVGSLNRSFDPVQTVRDELSGAVEAPPRPAEAPALGTSAGDLDGQRALPLPEPAPAPEPRDQPAGMPAEKA